MERNFSTWDHVFYGLIWAGFAIVLGLSAWLKPDPSGIGTHTGLHLPPCGFYLLFHKPCPSCGMTTAFALVMHGHPIKALMVQPAGFAVFVAFLSAWIYLPLGWKRRRPIEHLLDSRAFLPVVLGLILLILLVWVVRAFF